MDVLSIAAFETADARKDDDPGPAARWRIEMLHRDEPDRRALATLVEPIAARARMKHIRIDIEKLPDTDWVCQVQTAMAPRRIGRFWIHGSHVEAPPPAGLVPIELDAGLAFGSGEHATTQGCLLALDHWARRRRFRQVLDMGCGAGMLAIAAAKCWPAGVTAVDNDAVAVEVARENAERNGVAGKVGGLVSEGYANPELRTQAPYDLILSNILADPLCAMARDLARHLAVDGVAILSGLLDRQAGRVVAGHMTYGLFLRRRFTIGPWTTLVMSRKKA